MQITKIIRQKPGNLRVGALEISLGLGCPIRIAALLNRSCPTWTFQEVTGGLKAPLTRPDLVNPIVASFLRSPAD